MPRIVPSEFNATSNTGLKVGQDPVGCRVATSHSRTVPSAPPLARVLPSGLNATELTAPLEGGFPAGCPVATSHRRTIPSALPLARILPSRLNATELIASSWPVMGAPIWRWVATFHNRTVQSSAPLAMTLPSGLNATESISPSWQAMGAADLAVGRHVPQPHRAVVGAAGNDLAVPAERHRVDLTVMAGYRGADLAVGGEVP